MSIGESGYDLRISDDLAVYDQIRNELANKCIPIKNGKLLLLIDRVSSSDQFHDERVLYNLCSRPGFSEFKTTIAAPIISFVNSSCFIDLRCEEPWIHGYRTKDGASPSVCVLLIAAA